MVNQLIYQTHLQSGVRAYLQEPGGAKSRFIAEKPHTGWVMTSQRCIDGVFLLLTFHMLYDSMSQ